MMHTAPILIVRVYLAGRVVGECGYHGYTTQRFGVCVAPADKRDAPASAPHNFKSN